MKNTLIIGIIGFGMLTLTSCDKNDNPIAEETDLTTLSDYLLASSIFTLPDVEEATMDEENLKSTSFSECLNITVTENEDGEFWPLNKTLDYGTENCEDFIGNQRRGIIHVSISDWWRNSGSVRQITFEDYYFNDNKLEGTKTITNTGLNENENLTFTKLVENASVTYTDGTFVSWNSQRISELIEGRDTYIFADDVWSVTGSGNGINVDTHAFTVNITSPLIYKNGCFFPVSGIVEIATDGGTIEIINYGDGECDNQATLTVGDTTEVIDL